MDEIENQLSEDELEALERKIRSLRAETEPFRSDVYKCYEDGEKHNPKGAVSKCRGEAEVLTRKIVSVLGLPVTGHFDTDLKTLKKRVDKDVPREIWLLLDLLRVWGNRATHPEWGDADREKDLFKSKRPSNSLVILHGLLRVGEWYFTEFARGPRLDPLYAPREEAPGPHIASPPFLSKRFTSRFAATEEDLDAVLGLRHGYFGAGTIVPDDCYRECWKQNPDSMKIIYDTSGEAVGYWSLIPIGRQAFDAFLENKKSHSDMLTTEVLPWSRIDPRAVYLYLIGAVVPATKNRGGGSVLPSIISGRLLLDLFSFIEMLCYRLEVKGICGYPSRTGGLQIFKKMGFRENGRFIEKEKSQPICFVMDRDITGILYKYKKHYRLMEALPKWEKDDRKRFLQFLDGLESSSSSTPSPTPESVLDP